MALTTRCPNCGTAFKVVPDQLRVRKGLVRCGLCHTIFDGRACLLSEEMTAAAFPAPPAAPPPTGAHRSMASGTPSLPSVLRKRSDMIALSTMETAGECSVDDSKPWPMAVGPSSSSGTKLPPALGSSSRYFPASPLKSVATPSRGSKDAATDDDDGPMLGESRLRFNNDVDVGRAPPDFLNEDRCRYERRVWAAWGWACIGGLLALCLQLVFVYRSAIANAMPTLRPMMEAACAPLDCRVGYARRIERIAIVSSSLQPLPGVTAPENGSRVRLTLTVSLRNRYDRAQTWPALVLALTDLSDTVVIRKILLPDEYLSAEQARHPLPAGAEVTVSVPIEVAGVPVNGYQLDKFFP